MHTNTDLTKIDKFNYLVSLLEGTASRAIAGLPITEENREFKIPGRLTSRTADRK